MGLCGVVYIWMKTDFIDIMLHPAEYSTRYLASLGQNKAVGAILTIATFPIEVTKTNVLNCMKFFGDCYFGDYLIVLMSAAALTIYSLWIRRRKYELTGCKIRLRNFKLSQESGFVCVLLGTAIIYTLVIAMADIAARRYFSIAFMLFCIAFWYILDRILTKCIYRELIRGWYIILAAFVVLSALVPFKTRDIGIGYLYDDDRNLKSAVEPYRDMDVILVVHVDKAIGRIYRGETYDCVNQMSEKTNIYAVDSTEYLYDDVGFTDEFLLWGGNDQDISSILNDLAEHGYETESLGQNHISQAYVCRINEKERHK